MFLVQHTHEDGFTEIIETHDLDEAFELAKKSSLFWAGEAGLNESEVRIYRGEIFAVAKVAPTVALASKQTCPKCDGRLIEWSPAPYCVKCGHIVTKEGGNY